MIFGRRGEKGSITVFLAIVLTISIVLSGVLVDGARMRVGSTQVQEASENAAESALANYNNLLKDMYGLFALSENNPDNLKEAVEHYLNRTLMTELGIDKKEMGDKAFDYLVGMFTGENKYENVDFFNMFDYNVEDVKVTPLYNLTENQVFKAQVIEYMKYRAPKELIEGFADKLISFKDFGKQAKIMKEKTALDKSLNKIKKYQESLTNEIDKLNGYNADVFKADMGSYVSKISDSIQNELDKLKKEDEMAEKQKQIDQKNSEISAKQSEISSVNSQISQAIKEKRDTSALQAQLSALQSQLSTLQSEKAKLQSEYDALKAKRDEYEAKMKSLRDEASGLKTKMSDSADDYIEYNKNALDYVNKIEAQSKDATGKIDNINTNYLKGDDSDFVNNTRVDIGSKKEKIDPKRLEPLKAKFENNINVLTEMKNILTPLAPKAVYHEYGVTRSEGLGDIRSKVNTKVKRLNFDDYAGKYSDSIKFGIRTPKSNQEDPRDNANAALDNKDSIIDGGKTEEQKKQEATEDAEKEKEFPEDLPSKVSVASPDFNDEDMKYIKEMLEKPEGDASTNIETFTDDELKGILDGSKDIDFKEDDEEGSTEQSFNLLAKLGDIVMNGLESMRDELYVNEYAMGMFKNTLSSKPIYNTENEYERDLRDNVLKDRDTYFNSEVEYILTGNPNEGINRAGMTARILLVRFGLNTIHVYTDVIKFNRALTVATSIAGWTGFGVPIVHTLIMLGWSMAESILDVKFLMDGRAVPIFKTKSTWILGNEGLIKELKNQISQEFAKKANECVNKAVDYGVSTIQDLTESGKQRVDEIVKNKVRVAIDSVFAPLESGSTVADEAIDGAINRTVSNTNDILEDYSKSINDSLNSADNPEMNELQKLIYKNAQSEFNKIKDDVGIKLKQLEDQLAKSVKDEKDKIIEEIASLIKEKKEKMQGDIVELVNEKTKEIKSNIDKFASESGEAAKEKLNTYIDSLVGKASGGMAKVSLKTSLFSFTYQDYLRIFLLFSSKDTKLKRMQDLIQLNMRKMTNGDTFLLSDCNTYIRLEAEVSMKYLFMTQAIVPKEYKIEDGSRHKINVLLYKGY